MAKRPSKASPAPPSAASSPLDTAAFGLLLAVLAVRPLVLESSSADQRGVSPGLPSIYVLSTAQGAAADGAAFVGALLPDAGPPTPRAFEIGIARGAVASGHALTAPGVPGRPRWETGRWIVALPVQQPGAGVELRVGFARAGPDGASRHEMRFTEWQALTDPGVYNFPIPALVMPPGDADDRVRVEYAFRNLTQQPQAVVIVTDALEARVTAPPVDVPALPGSVLTAGFDFVILVAFLLAALAAARDPRRATVTTGVEIGTLLLLLALGVSTVVAGNQRLALVAASDFACLLLFFHVLARLVRRPWQVRLTLCVVVAAGAVAAARCVEQAGYEIDETIAEFNKANAGSGGETDDAMARLFRSRLESREATAYMAHPNIAGSHLMLAAFAAAALAAAKWTAPPRTYRRLFAVLTAGLAGFLLVAVFLTGWRGAVVAGVGSAAVVLALACAPRDWLAQRRRRLVAVAWGVVLLAGLAVVGWGGKTGGLPGGSMTFRWHYWSTAWPLIGDHLAGVGSGHFGQHYLRYKPVEFPDEVANAHNLFVHAAAEWGVLGLAGLVAMLVGASLTLTATPADTSVAASAPRPGRALAYVGGLTLTTLAVRAFALTGAGGAYVVVAAVIPAVMFPLAFIVAALDSDRLERFDDAPLPAMRWFLAAGLLYFIIHNMISFSFFVSGAAMPFFALAALVLRRRAPAGATATPSSARRLALPVVAAIVLAVFCVGVAWPVATTGRHLYHARHESHYGRPAVDPAAHPAARHFHAAIDADPLDPTPAADWAQWLTDFPYDDPAAARTALDHAAALLDRAARRDPDGVSIPRRRRQVFHQAFLAANDAARLRDAIRAGGEVIARYPQSPPDHLAQAELFDMLFQATAEPDAARRAVAHYHRALDFDDMRTPDEIRRFGRAEREHAEQRILALVAPPPADAK